MAPPAAETDIAGAPGAASGAARATSTSRDHNDSHGQEPSSFAQDPLAAGAPTADDDTLVAEELRRPSSRDSRLAQSLCRTAAGPSLGYDVPDNYRNLSDAFTRPPVQNPDEQPITRVITREDDRAAAAALGELPGKRRRSLVDSGPAADASGAAEPTGRRLAHTASAERAVRMMRRRSTAQPVEYDVPNMYANLDELTVSPVENPDESPLYEHHSLEEMRSRRESDYPRERPLRRQELDMLGPVAAASLPPPEDRRRETEAREREARFRVSRLATHIYTISYLVLFAIFGTLARLGLQALTTYSGTPVTFSSIWPNFAGSLVMGFLAEDRMLFRFEWGTPTYDIQVREARKNRDEENGSASNGSDQAANIIDLAVAKRAHLATKKTIPLYIGLATGFCGSFTSFSAFIRDIFLALSNDMSSADPPRNGGYSFMAVLAVIILTVSLSLSGLFIGAHFAIALEPITPSLPYRFTRKVLDRLTVVLGWGCWLGAVLLSALPPDRSGASPDTWRGKATFALVFAPLGCLGRFYASLYLNGRIAAFPLGTFTVNIIGTLILGMSWDLARVPLGGVIGCQVLQGVEDGFCGCLTTVSTWVAELSALRRRNAYFYGTASVLVGLAVLVAIMGGLKWSSGFAPLQCVH